MNETDNLHLRMWQLAVKHTWSWSDLARAIHDLHGRIGLHPSAWNDLEPETQHICNIIWVAIQYPDTPVE